MKELTLPISNQQMGVYKAYRWRLFSVICIILFYFKLSYMDINWAYSHYSLSTNFDLFFFTFERCQIWHNSQPDHIILRIFEFGSYLLLHKEFAGNVDAEFKDNNSLSTIIRLADSTP
ncbi:MAG: hypothetical protein IPN18_18535 [Ignavibacteriales bacterium]|nr:hypothetical protein [Ignavibacteriales bacterium]